MKVILIILLLCFPISASADTIEALFTFETGGQAVWKSAEGRALLNVTLVTTPLPPHPDYENYVLRLAPANTSLTWTSPSITLAGLETIAFQFQHPLGTGGADNFTQDIMTITSDDIDWTFRLQHIGTPIFENRWQIVNAVGGVSLIGTDIFAPNTWHRLAFQYGQADSGFMLILLNEVLIQSFVLQDFRGGTGGDITIQLKSLLSGGNGANYYFKTMYVMSDSTPVTGLLGDTVVRAYRVGKDSTSPDSDTSGSPGSGQTLNGGNWKDISDNSIAATAVYTGNGNEGAVACNTTANNGVPGPKHDPAGVHRDAVIIGAKWIGHFSGGTGAAMTDLVFGKRRTNSDYGFSLTAEATGGVRGHFYSHFEETGAPGERVPTAEEQIAIGFGKTDVAIQNISMREGWAVVWYQGSDPSIAPDPTVHIKGAKLLGGHIK